MTKETLKAFLKARPGLSVRGLCLHAGVNENAISQLYNKSGRSLTEALSSKLIEVLPLYGWGAGREPLRDFMLWQEDQDISQFDDCDTTIERYLESL